MKIVYCIPSLLNMGGLKRILTNKINYLVNNYNYDIVVITRNLNNQTPYYNLSDKVEIYDIKTKSISNKNIFLKLYTYFVYILYYYKDLKTLLYQIKPGITISVFSLELYFLFFIQDGSKKIVECHGPRYFWSTYPAKGVKKIIRRLRDKLHSLILRKYDEFIVLTNEDRKAWAELNNVSIIPNFIKLYTDRASNLSSKRVISVGRLCEGKRFDHLIRAWSIVKEYHPSWSLDIIGEGPLKGELQCLIDKLDLNDVVNLKGESKDIVSEYLSASIFVLASEHEGLPMVLLEAMSCGLPLVSYNCPCGPKDLIKDGVNGYLVECQDYIGLSNKIVELINNPKTLSNMGSKNLILVEKYSESNIMMLWNRMFISLLSK